MTNNDLGYLILPSVIGFDAHIRKGKLELKYILK